MQKNFLKLVIPSVMALLISACASLQPFFAEPQVDFQEMAVSDISMSEATLLFTFQVYNPNPITVPLDRIKYDLVVGDRSMAGGRLKMDTRLPAVDTGVVRFPVTINFLEAYAAGAQLYSGESMPYKLSTTFNIMGFSLPYEAEGDFRLPEFPRISLASAKIVDMTLQGAKIDFVLEMDNPNQFPVHPKSMDYGIELGGIPFIHVKNQNIKPLSPDGQTQIVLPAQIDFLGMGRSAMSLLNQQSVNYTLTGNLAFDSEAGQKAIPFSRSGNVSIR